MSANLTAEIQAALDTGRINIIALMKIVFRPGETLNWSTALVPGHLTGEGIIYDDRIESIGPLTFKAGFKDADVTVSFSNHDNMVKTMADDGCTWEGAEVKICYLFIGPDLPPGVNQVGSWENPYWWGWINQAPSFEDLSKMKISSGFSELNREALRREEWTAPDLLGSEHFPYNPLGGKGLPQIKASGTATGGSGSTLTTTDDISSLKQSWLIFIKTKKIIGRIVSAAAGSVEVEEWFYGGAATAIIPESGDSWIAGPVYTSYDGTEVNCKIMGMFGPNSEQDENSLNTDTRRWFNARGFPGNAFLEKRVQIKTPGTSLYSSVEGADPEGEIIPVNFGNFERTVKPRAWGLVEGEGYIHFYGIVGQGRCAYLGEPLLDGVYHVDNINPAGPATDDSWIEGGTDFPGADDSDGVTSGELTLSQQKQAIGSRQARARNHDETINTYKSNPLGFNAPTGEGCSPSSITWIRGRWQRKGYSISGEPVVRIRGKGIETLTPSGTWTKTPSIIDALHYFLINQLWGCQLSAARRLNIDDFITTAAIAGEEMPSAGSDPKALTGTLVAGPEDATAPTLPPCVAILPASLPLGQTREDGLTCIIETATKTYSMIVRGEAELTGPEIMSWIRTPEGNTRSAVISDVGWLLVFYSNFDGEIPAAGDKFTLSGKGITSEGVIRYQADGSLAKNTTRLKTVEAIMRNCNGTVIPKRGKISPVIRGAVDLAAVNARRIYTDKGPDRNVIFSGGESTFKFTPTPSKEVPTSVRVEFTDTEHGYQVNPFTVRNSFAEERKAALTGENSQDSAVEVLDLNLTGTFDQAVRVAAVYLNEHSYIRGVPGYTPGKYVLEVPVHDGLDLWPVEDVFPIYSEKFPYWCRYMRIEEFSDNYARGTISIQGSPYLEEMYGDSKTDFIISPGPIITPMGPGSEQPQIVISSLVEGTHRDDEAGLIVSISGEITLL